jgi:chromosome segregation ATPase
MPRRTIAQARWVLENELPATPGQVSTALRAVLGDAEAKARSEADTSAADLERRVLELRDNALRELTEVRDAMDELRTTSANGRASASNHSRRLNELRQQQERAEAKLAEALTHAERIEAIEADPVAYYDDLTSRHPQLLTDFPW